MSGKNWQLIDDETILIENTDNLDLKMMGGISPEVSNRVKKIVIGNGVTNIESLFMGDDVWRNVQEVEMGDSVQTIGNMAFSGFESLKSIKLSQNLTTLGRYAFKGCKNLKELILPEGLKIIKSYALAGVDNLEFVDIPGTVKSCWNIFGEYSGKRINEKPLTIKLNEGIEEFGVDGGLPDGVMSLTCPNSLKNFQYYSPDSLSLTKPQYIELGYKTEVSGLFDNNKKKMDPQLNLSVRYNDRVVDLNNIVDYGKSRGNGMIYLIHDIDENGKKISSGVLADNQGNARFFTKDEVLAKATKWNELSSIRYYGIHNLLFEWNKYKNVPHRVVVESMPTAEIPLFYTNNNAQNWAKVVQALSDTKQLETLNVNVNLFKQDVFNLAHALGVFSQNGAESQKATEFILTEIKDKVSIQQIHEYFNAFKSYETPYNAEFAKFFMQYFPKNHNFMVPKLGGQELNDNLLSECHNRFAEIQAQFPNKKVVTRQDNERLTPQMAMDFLISQEYENVDERAQQMADVVRMFGYDQKTFEQKIQPWYLEGLSITPEQQMLFISPDDKNQMVKYELLDRADPLGLVIGNLTNCCQRFNGAGEECLKYGMTQPNSGFMVFYNGKDLLGQSWVWYDPENEQVTLDNIEVPHKIQERLNNDPQLKQEFMNCLYRVGYNFDATMNSKGLPVKDVTIGAGYNKFTHVLDEELDNTKNLKLLSNYKGYTDADEKQYALQHEGEGLKEVAVKY